MKKNRWSRENKTLKVTGVLFSGYCQHIFFPQILISLMKNIRQLIFLCPLWHRVQNKFAMHVCEQNRSMKHRNAFLFLFSSHLFENYFTLWNQPQIKVHEGNFIIQKNLSVLIFLYSRISTLIELEMYTYWLVFL